MPHPHASNALPGGAASCRHPWRVTTIAPEAKRESALSFLGPGPASLGRCGMRHLLVATAMIAAGLAVTMGIASILQDVAIASSKSAQGDRFEVNQLPKPAMKPARQSRPSAIDRPYDSHF